MVSYPPSDLDTDCRMEEEGLWWLYKEPQIKGEQKKKSRVSLRAEVVKLCSTELWNGVHGPCQLPLPFNRVSVIIMIRASLLWTHTVPNTVLSTLHRLRCYILTRAPRRVLS